MIHVNHVTKCFGPVVALDDVSLDICNGEHVAFVGSNGSGKTTLLRAILGLLRVDGRVTIAGVDVAKSPEIALRRVAYIPQIAPPIDAPVSEVVRAHASLRKIDASRTREAAGTLGLELDGVRGTRFRDLSGGMKQKLLAAMALAADPDVLVCDEPTANLDASARAAFFDEVKERFADRIVVLCSHRAEEVDRLVERVIEMRDGRIARDGNVARMRAHHRKPLLKVLP